MSAGQGPFISYEKILLFGLIVFIFATVLLLEIFVPHQSAALLIMIFIILHAGLVNIVGQHHRRRMAKQVSPLMPVPPSEPYQPSVMVVVPAHNEVAVIDETVRNLLALDYPDLSLWIFDDRSVDGTGEALARLSEAFPGRFNYEIRPGTAMPGKSAVLNDAIERTQSEVILVFDADARVAPDFVRRAVPYLAEPGVGAAQARKIILNADVNLLARCQGNEYLLDAHFQVDRDTIRAAVELRGNGQFVKRAALQSVGAWTEETITDDLDLSTKLHVAGWDIRAMPDVLVYEEGILHFKPLLRQRRRWAEGSLKRYLEYGFEVLTSPHVSKRAFLDMIAYFIEFIFPLWVTADLFVQWLAWLFGDGTTHLTSTLIILPMMGGFFFYTIFVSIRQFDYHGFRDCLVRTMETTLFMMIVWVPVVMWITAKILVSKNDGPLNWGKTEHLGTLVAVKRSRLDRLKALIQRPGGSSWTPPEG